MMAKVKITDDGWGGLLLRGNAEGNTYYELYLQRGGNLQLVKTVADTRVGIMNPYVGWFADEYWYIKAEVSGDSIKGKAWPCSDPEPATWLVEWTDSTPITSGRIGLITFSWWATKLPVYFDDVLVTGPEDGTEIKEKTETRWTLTIEVTNPFGYTMTNAKITDRFGAEIEIDEPFPYSITHGTVSNTTKGRSAKVFLTWDIGDLLPGETAILILLVSTDLNPKGHQEYSEPGVYELNSGATLKFIDPEQDVQLSAYIDSIYVTVLPADDC